MRRPRRRTEVLDELYAFLQMSGNRSRHFWCFRDGDNNSGSVTHWHPTDVEGVYEYDTLGRRFSLLGYGYTAYNSGKKSTQSFFRIEAHMTDGQGCTGDFDVFFSRDLILGHEARRVYARNEEEVLNCLNDAFCLVLDSAADEARRNEDQRRATEEHDEWVRRARAAGRT